MEHILSFGPLTIDFSGMQVRFKGKSVDLTATEFSILRTLTASPGKVFSREELLDGAWGESFIAGQRTVDIHVSNLRRKLSSAGESTSLIQSVRGIGYKFQVSPDFAPQDRLAESGKETPNNLPSQLTRFIGREKETEQACRLLDQNRLVTLAGSGGSGKTRLALRVAESLLEEFCDGVWFADLSPLQDAGLIAEALASSLGVKEELNKEAREVLKERLSTGKILLVLDNCEHLVKGCAEICSELLSISRRLVILATSREALGIPGEVIFQVPPLPVPGSEDETNPESALRFASAQLFLDRARAILPGFDLTGKNLRHLVKICRRLSGIPLAIELAAAWVNVLTLEDIAGRLEDRFIFLARGNRTAVPRHQTLAAAIDWSCNLLTPEEQRLFYRLSVFAGGFALEAMESVCEGGLELLSKLVDKSLVLVDHRQEMSRYRLLETTRQFAWEKLCGTGEEQEFRERHKNFFLALSKESEPHIMGEDEDWIRRLEADQDNLRAALSWCAEPGKSSDEFTRMVGGLWKFWYLLGHRAEAGAHLARALSASAGHRTEPRGKVLMGAGVMARDQGDPAAAGRFLEDSLGVFEELGDKRMIAYALSYMGGVVERTGNYPKAREHFEKALSFFEQLGDPQGCFISLRNLGSVAWSQGDYSGCRSLIEKSIPIARRLGQKSFIATATHNLGVLAISQGDLERARVLIEDGLTKFREIGEKRGMAVSLINMTEIELEAKNLEAARELSWQSLLLLRDLQIPLLIANCLDVVGELSVQLGHDVRGAQLLGCADAIRKRTGEILSEPGRDSHEKYMETVRNRLGETKFSLAWKEGESFGMEEGIQVAFQELIKKP